MPAPLSPNARFDAPRWQPRVTALWKASWPHLGPPPSSSFLHHSTAFSRLQVEVANPRSFFFFFVPLCFPYFHRLGSDRKSCTPRFCHICRCCWNFWILFFFFWIFANERRSITTREWLKVILTKNSYQTFPCISFYFLPRIGGGGKVGRFPKGS